MYKQASTILKNAFLLNKTNLTSKYVLPSQNLWSWLNIVFNYVDKSRIKEVGPDIACAEWLLRNGAFVKWVGSKSELQDYNQIPKCPTGKYIQQINATESSIMGYGFEHFRNCKYIDTIYFHKCSLLDDSALEKLDILKESLSNLEIISCGDITDKGLLKLTKLTNLKSLKVQNLPYVKFPEETIACIKRVLCNCEVNSQL